MKVIKAGAELGDVRVVEWDGSLKQLQEMVDGYIEVVNQPYLTTDRVKIIVNEEGILKGLPINYNLNPYFYVGNVIFIGVEGENFTGLTDKEIYNVMYLLEF